MENEHAPSRISLDHGKSPFERICTFIESTGAKYLRGCGVVGSIAKQSPAIEKYLLPSGEAVLVESIPGRAADELTGVEVYSRITTSARLDTTEKAISELAAGVRTIKRATLPAFLLDEHVGDVTRALMQHYQRLADQNLDEAKRWLSQADDDEGGDEMEKRLGFVESHTAKAREYKARVNLYRAMTLSAKDGETLGEPAK